MYLPKVSGTVLQVLQVYMIIRTVMQKWERDEAAPRGREPPGRGRPTDTHALADTPQPAAQYSYL